MRSLLLTSALLLAALGLAAPAASAGPLGTGSACVASPSVVPNQTYPEPGHVLGCVSWSDEQGALPDAGVCVTDGVVATFAWWYGGLGDLVCIRTDGEAGPFHFDLLPGVCIDVGPDHFALGCVNHYEPAPVPPGGYRYCYFRISGHSLCQVE